MRKIVLLAAALTMSPAVHAVNACAAETGDRVVPLLELYTSEGCDSCPPADRWLSANFPAGAATDGVALAFHVDYWDRLGWADRFASPVYTARQQQASRANRAAFVYTPQLLLQGRDYTAWRRGSPANVLATVAARRPRARIALRADVTPDVVEAVIAVTLAEAPRRDTVVALAYADSRLVSEVRAGENRGVTLTHDHVVRAFGTRELVAATGNYSIALSRPREGGVHATLVAFVQDVASGDVLQTLALPLERCAK